MNATGRGKDKECVKNIYIIGNHVDNRKSSVDLQEGAQFYYCISENVMMSKISSKYVLY
jgi:hypothetical protein